MTGTGGRGAHPLGRTCALLAVAAAAFVGGYQLAGGDEPAGSTTFHDMRVRPPSALMGLVDPDDLEVREIALRHGTPEQAYLFVRDAVRYQPSLPLTAPAQTLAERQGSCLSKAVLLASLYRALGMDHEQVRVVAGLTVVDGEPMEHAWLEIEWGGRCYQQDPTTLLGSFGFSEFADYSYTRAFVERELFCFNDSGFAVVSVSNRFRGRVDPHLRVTDETLPGAPVR